MILICITFVLSIFLFIAAPVLTEWSLGYLNIRSMYDIQISTRYNKVYDEADLPIDNFEFVTDFLTKKVLKQVIIVLSLCICQVVLISIAR